MLLPLNWLQDILKIRLDAKRLADLLMYKSLEVEKIENPAEHLDKIIVAKILEIKEHPNADKLRLVVCEVANGRRQQVVCGGSNLQKGMKVAFATLGARVRWHGEGDLVELKPAEIRGEKSEGMICASTEIGLGEIFPPKDSHEILDISWVSAAPGTPVAEALDLGPVLELAVLPNRADLLSIRGLAREVAALMDKKAPAFPPVRINEDSSLPLKNYLTSVKIEDKKNCLKYGARAVVGVKVGESPEWLKKRLIQVGMNPINNIVDITNFVLMELGQPLHAFDADKLHGKQIVVRAADAGAKFIALDNKEYAHDPSMLVIADNERAVAIAGVMGGKETGISSETKNIIIESALFHPSSVRKTARKLSLHSDSSLRFERGIDPALQELALDYAARLVADICGGKIAKGKIVISNVKSVPVKIKVSLAYLKKILGFADSPSLTTSVPSGRGMERLGGVTLSIGKIKSILTFLGCKVAGGKDLVVSPPSFRQDLRHPADIAEEVGRIYGYDKLGIQYLSGELRPPEVAGELKIADWMRDQMAKMGFDEVLSYSFYSEKEARSTGWEHLELENPINPNQKFLRTGVATHLLELAREIQRRGEEARIFEIGKVFLPTDPLSLSHPALARIASRKGETTSYPPLLTSVPSGRGMERRGGVDNGVLPKEDWHLAAVIIKKQPADKNFMEMRGVAERLWLDSVVNVVEGVAVFEINLTEIAPNFFDRAHFEPLSEFPSITRDLALVFDEDKKWEEIRKVIKAEGGELLGPVFAFDVYRGPLLSSSPYVRGGEEGLNKKSIAFRMTFSAPDRTLKAEEVDKLIEKVKSALEAKFNAKAR